MKLTGFLIGPDNKPLQGGTVQLVDQSGKSLGPGTSTDDRGFFAIDHPLLADKNTMVQFSYVGMKSVRMTADEVYDALEIFLENSDSSMEEVVVTAKVKKKKPVKPNYTLPIVLASSALALTVFLIYKKTV